MHDIHNINDKHSSNIQGRQRVGSTQVYHNFGYGESCSDLTSFYKSQKIKVMHDFDDLRKRYKFTITNNEVAYLRKIHYLNVPRKTTPRLIYFVHTVTTIHK